MSKNGKKYIKTFENLYNKEKLAVYHKKKLAVYILLRWWHKKDTGNVEKSQEKTYIQVTR